MCSGRVGSSCFTSDIVKRHDHHVMEIGSLLIFILNAAYMFVDRWLSLCPFSLVIVLSVRLPCTDPGYPYGIFFFGHCVVCPSSMYDPGYPYGIFFFGHCVVCPSSMYGSWLPLWYLILWSLCCLSVFHVRILVTPMVSFSLVIVLSVRLPCTDPGYPYGIFKLFLQLLYINILLTKW